MYLNHKNEKNAVRMREKARLSDSAGFAAMQGCSCTVLMLALLGHVNCLLHSDCQTTRLFLDDFVAGFFLCGFNT